MGQLSELYLFIQGVEGQVDQHTEVFKAGRLLGKQGTVRRLCSFFSGTQTLP